MQGVFSHSQFGGLGCNASLLGTDPDGCQVLLSDRATILRATPCQQFFGEEKPDRRKKLQTELAAINEFIETVDGLYEEGDVKELAYLAEMKARRTIIEAEINTLPLPRRRSRPNSNWASG